MKWSELAAKYNLTIEQLQKERVNFLMSEGWDEDGNEHDDLESWLNRKDKKIFEPRQKGDELDN